MLPNNIELLNCTYNNLIGIKYLLGFLLTAPMSKFINKMWKEISFHITHSFNKSLLSIYYIVTCWEYGTNIAVAFILGANQVVKIK
jgi:hypothetical protein